MAGAASAGRDDAFEVGRLLRIHNPALNVDVTIHDPFVKEVEGDRRFVSLDFYQSRGVYALLSSRLPKKSVARRPYAKVLAKVVAKLKRKRDVAFRAGIQGDAPESKEVKFAGRYSVLPKTSDRTLRAMAMARSDVVECDMPPLEGESDRFRLACLVPLGRRNQNTELFVDAKSTTWDFLTKLVAQEYRAPQDEEEGASATVAPAEAAALPVVAHPSPGEAALSRQSPIAAASDDTSCAEGSDDSAE